MGLIRTLPKNISIAEDRQMASNKMDKLLMSANKGLGTLLALHDDLGEIPTNCKEINLTWLTNKVNAQIESIQNYPLPKATKCEMLEEWASTEQTAKQAIEQVQELYTLPHNPKFEIQEQQIVCTNYKEWLERMSTYTADKVFVEHYRLICNVLESIDKLRYYEKNNNIPKRMIDKIQSRITSPEAYLQLTAIGYFTKEPTTEQNCRRFPYIYSYQ
jgi:hypothetical protein